MVRKDLRRVLILLAGLACGSLSALVIHDAGERPGVIG